MNEIRPRHRQEEIALFRAQMLGVLLHGDRHRGQLRAELEELSQRRVRPPGSRVTRTYAVATLERWLYAYRPGGLAALMPKPRSDRGRGRSLPPELATLASDIRREFPHVSASLIRETLISSGRMEPATASESTLRRVLRQQGLVRTSRKGARASATGRLRWRAAQPNMVWHADVCHGPTLHAGSQKLPLRIHAILDDASRFIVAIWASHTEQEVDMLRLLYTAPSPRANSAPRYLRHSVPRQWSHLSRRRPRHGLSADGNRAGARATV